MFLQLSQWLSASFPIPAPWSLTLPVAAAVSVLGILAYKVLFSLLGRLAGRTDTHLDDLLLARMRLPARALVLLWVIHTILTLREVGLSGVRAGVLVVELLLMAYLAVEAAETLFFDWWLAERRRTPVPALLRHLVLILVYVAVFLSVLSTATGLNIAPVLATSTVVTVVLGLALQDTLGNLFSGLALHFDRPFAIGDWVLVDGVEGCVVSISWRSTVLRTLNRDHVAVPNSQIARARVQNHSQPARLTGRNLELLVALDAAPEAVEHALRVAAAQVPGVLEEPAPKAWLVGVLPFGQRYVVRLWVEEFDRHDDIESNLMKALWHSARASGVALREVAAVGADAQGQPVAVSRRP